MKIFVVGSKGFIGSHIVDKYKNHDLIQIDRRNEWDLENNIYPYDINHVYEPKLLELLKDVDVVNMHAAQIDVRKSIQDPYKDAEENIMMTLRLLKLCIEAKVKRFIFASSGGAIDNSEFPSSPYGIYKYTIERYLDFYNKYHKLETVSLRYSNVYGPRQTGGVISLFIPKLLNNQPIEINGGDQTRDFIYVSDVVNANQIGLTCQSGIYTIASENSISIIQLANLLKKLTKSKSEIIINPYIEGEVLESNLKIVPPKNWKPIISLEDGLKKTIKYFRQNRY